MSDDNRRFERLSGPKRSLKREVPGTSRSRNSLSTPNPILNRAEKSVVKKNPSVHCLRDSLMSDTIWIYDRPEVCFGNIYIGTLLANVKDRTKRSPAGSTEGLCVSCGDVTEPGNFSCGQNRPDRAESLPRAPLAKNRSRSPSAFVLLALFVVADLPGQDSTFFLRYVDWYSYSFILL